MYFNGTVLSDAEPLCAVSRGDSLHVAPESGYPEGVIFSETSYGTYVKEGYFFQLLSQPWPLVYRCLVGLEACIEDLQKRRSECLVCYNAE